MSIISEALKKVENSSENRPQLLVSSEPGKKGFNRLMVFLLAAIAVGIAFKSLTAHRVTKQGNSSVPETNQTALVPAPLQDEKLLQKVRNLSASSFQLSGIALMEGKSFAIINGDIFKEGDKVEGAKLIKITKDKVTLDREGNQIQLSLK